VSNTVDVYLLTSTLTAQNSHHQYYKYLYMYQVLL